MELHSLSHSRIVTDSHLHDSSTRTRALFSRTPATTKLRTHHTMNFTSLTNFLVRVLVWSESQATRQLLALLLLIGSKTKANNLLSKNIFFSDCFVKSGHVKAAYQYLCLDYPRILSFPVSNRLIIACCKHKNPSNNLALNSNDATQSSFYLLLAMYLKN